MINKIRNITHFLLIILAPIYVAAEAGQVLLVIGSDTAIWDGMTTSRYHCTYNPELYTNPADNAYAVMDMDFRNQMKDSYGTPMKLTWWMMAGNIFRYATNTNVPIPNIMTMYLMKKYHGDVVEQAGDELSLHYHTFKWSDYNEDGLWYWNQAQNFEECRSDFDVTLSQFLLEEQIFPVSFRSGWHYMDNEWQAYLNDLLPYSMHNAYPSKKTHDTEPTDNIIDWSQAPSEFVPYHPSADNYQIPGNTAGWNLRSAHLNSVRYKNLMDTVFSAAAKGRDQVACFWGHLPENDFKSNLVAMDSLAHAMEDKYPDVKFRYCTAVEAMQRWQNSQDSTEPELNISQLGSGEETYFEISVSEDIFQPQPYVAAKNIYEEYFKISCQSTGPNNWETAQPVNINTLAKIGVAVCDSMGNQTLEIQGYLPDDQYIDNEDEQFSIEKGIWSNYTAAPWESWGNNSQITPLEEGETSRARWSFTIKESRKYNIFYRVPPFSNQVENFYYIIKNGTEVDTVEGNYPVRFDQWNYLKTMELDSNQGSYIEMKAIGPGRMAADAVKITPLVKDHDLQAGQKVLNPGNVSIDDTTSLSLELSNQGIKELVISDLDSKNGYIFHNLNLPDTIPAMGDSNLDLKFYSKQMGEIQDTLIITSNDPHKPQFRVPLIANVENYFTILDNGDSSHYKESGDWSTSVAQAYGPSSRYSWLDSESGNYAIFETELKYEGVYDILEIVPETENASQQALYILKIAGVTIDTTIINQNEGSGNWVKIWRQYLPANEKIAIKIQDDISQNVALRADAVKFQLIQQVSVNRENEFVEKFELDQNYPNPFNATTTISYTLPEASQTRMVIYNSLGQKVAQPVNKFQQSGHYQIKWRPQNLSSGLYIYKLSTDKFSKTKKMLLIK